MPISEIWLWILSIKNPNPGKFNCLLYNCWQAAGRNHYSSHWNVWLHFKVSPTCGLATLHFSGLLTLCKATRSHHLKLPALFPPLQLRADIVSSLLKKQKHQEALLHALITKPVKLLHCHSLTPPHCMEYMGAFRKCQRPGSSAWRLQPVLSRQAGVFLKHSIYFWRGQGRDYNGWWTVSTLLKGCILIALPSPLVTGFTPEITPTIFWVNNFTLIQGLRTWVYKMSQ